MVEVVSQHVEEAMHLRRLRRGLVRAPHVRLSHLARFDERLAAHLDGIGIAGSCGAQIVRQSLESLDVGSMFVATARAISARDTKALGGLLAVAEAAPECRAGLLSAFGWVSAEDLRGIVRELIESPYAWHREVGLVACAMHGVDPGMVLASALSDPATALRERALRHAGAAGRVDLREACLRHVEDENERCAFEAARAALRLGDRHEAVHALECMAAPDASDRECASAATCTVVKVLDPVRARALLSEWARDPQGQRTAIKGIAASGHPGYVPWLLEQMDQPTLARIAGEAFTLITGLDLAPIEAAAETVPMPNDDAQDEDVGMDEDDGLPWPVPAKLATWWQEHRASFDLNRRYLLGEVVSPARCAVALHHATQPQRAVAAEHLVLATPGRRMFSVAAPSWRQKRRLASASMP